MVKKRISKHSTERKVSLFHNVPLSTISLLQALEKNKDAMAIKKALNKPNLSNPTALAYGRLANQYIILLSNPMKIEIAQVKRRFSIILTNDYKQNLILLGNQLRGPPPPPPTITFRELIRMGGTLGTMPKSGHIYTELINPDLPLFFTNLRLLDNNVGLINKNGITRYRVYVEFDTDSGNTVIISTSVLTIPSFEIIADFVNNADIMSETAMLYDYEDEVEVLRDIVSITVEYR